MRIKHIMFKYICNEVLKKRVQPPVYGKNVFLANVYNPTIDLLSYSHTEYRFTH